MEHIADIININSVLVTLVSTTIIAIVRHLWKQIKKIKQNKEWRKNEIDENLYDFYNHLDKKNLKCYIETMGQYEAPHDNEEPCEGVSDRRFSLIDFFLNKFLDSNDHSKQRFLVLAGSGMGKSTFSVHLFLRYINKHTESKAPYKFKILYLGKDNIVERIESLKKQTDPKKTILLLESLDESYAATIDFNTFFSQIDTLTDDFKFVIVTSRTQFFANATSETQYVHNKQNSLNKSFIRYETIYISPFSINESKTYLSKKYSKKSEEYERATNLLTNYSSLVARPMLLYFMDVLVKSNKKSFESSLSIYEELIDLWLDREVEQVYEIDKRAIVKERLFSLSEQVALTIYDYWIDTGISYIPAELFDQFLSEHKLTEDGIQLRERSLLNRNSDGGVKFSHKSIWEFFLAEAVNHNPRRRFMKNGIDFAYTLMEERFMRIINSHPTKSRIEYTSPSYFYQTCNETYNQLTDNNIPISDKARALTQVWNSILRYINYLAIMRSNVQTEVDDGLAAEGICFINIIMSISSKFAKGESYNVDIIALRKLLSLNHFKQSCSLTPEISVFHSDYAIRVGFPIGFVEQNLTKTKFYISGYKIDEIVLYNTFDQEINYNEVLACLTGIYKKGGKIIRLICDPKASVDEIALLCQISKNVLNITSEKGISNDTFIIVEGEINTIPICYIATKVGRPILVSLFSATARSAVMSALERKRDPLTTIINSYRNTTNTSVGIDDVEVERDFMSTYIDMPLVWGEIETPERIKDILVSFMSIQLSSFRV